MIAWVLVLCLLLIAYITFLIIGMGRSTIQRINALENEVLRALKIIEQRLAEKIDYGK